MSNYNTTITNCFTLLRLLHENGLMKAKDLAYKLNVSEKQIRRYITALKLAGVLIESKSGKNGGFYIHENECPLCHNIKHFD